LFAIFPIIFLFSNNVNSVYPNEIILPLLLSILITFLIWIAISFVLKSKIKSGFITSLGLIVFFSYGHIFILIDEFQKNVFLSHLFLLILSFILLGVGSYYFIRTKKSLINVTKIVNVVSISVVMISFFSIGEFYMTENYTPDDLSEVAKVNPIQQASGEDLPDIYYIILDAYGGSEAQKIFLNYTNSEFIDFLTKKGFFVSSKSYSNYLDTAFSVTSTLNMKYLNYLTEEKGIDSSDKTELVKMSRDNIVFQYLKSKGYTIFNIESGSVHTGSMKNVDFVLCAPKNYATSEFEMMLIRTTLLNSIHVQLFSGDKRDKILCGFSELGKMSERNDNPKFVLAHLMIPHRPYLFGANGEVIIPKFLSLDNQDVNWDSDLYLGQLKFANKKMIDVVEQLTKTDTPPIIIIQSDHGMRGIEPKNLYENNLKLFNNFKSYYFPEKGRNLEFETTTPVNSFRVLFNLYFDDDYEILEDKIYSTNLKKPHEFRDVTKILIKD